MGSLMLFMLSFAFSVDQVSPPDKVYDESMKKKKQEEYLQQKKMMEYRLKAEKYRLKFEKQKREQEDQ